MVCCAQHFVGAKGHPSSLMACYFRHHGGEVCFHPHTRGGDGSSKFIGSDTVTETALVNRFRSVARSKSGCAETSVATSDDQPPAVTIVQGCSATPLARRGFLCAAKTPNKKLYRSITPFTSR